MQRNVHRCEASARSVKVGLCAVALACLPVDDEPALPLSYCVVSLAGVAHALASVGGFILSCCCARLLGPLSFLNWARVTNASTASYPLPPPIARSSTSPLNTHILAAATASSNPVPSRVPSVSPTHPDPAKTQAGTRAPSPKSAMTLPATSSTRRAKRSSCPMSSSAITGATSAI